MQGKNAILKPMTPKQVADEIEKRKVSKGELDKAAQSSQVASQTRPKGVLMASKSTYLDEFADGETTLMHLIKSLNMLSEELKASLPANILALLEEFKDVFPDDIPPGLPPIRGIEHQIDLIPGASLPNKPAYRMNPTETQEVQSQV